MKRHTPVDIAKKLFNYSRVEENGCWTWLKYKDSLGYGKIAVNGRCMSAHRYAWELICGRIPDGLVIDHLCRNTSCCNPDHLRVVTNAENVACSNGVGPKNARKTHCSKGHPYNEKNTDAYIDPKGKKRRMCKMCRLKFKGLGWRATITECKHGHPFDESNTYYRKGKNGKMHRMCKKCHALSQGRRYHRLKSK